MLFDYRHYGRIVGTSQTVARETLPTVDSAITVLNAEHRFSFGLGLSLAVPLGVVTRTPNESSDEETLRVSGLGDVALGGRFPLDRLWGGGRFRLEASLGLGLPTGSPATAGQDDASIDTPAVLALGRGAYGVRAGLLATLWPSRDVAVSAQLRGQAQLGSGPTGITFGPEVGWRVGVALIPTDWLVFGAALDGRHVGVASQEVRGDLLNSGGFHMDAVAHATVTVAEGTSVVLSATVPAHSSVHGVQTALDYGVSVGLVTGWSDDADEGGDAHDHDAHDDDAHDHHEEQRTGAVGDIRDVGVRGGSFTAEDIAVPGRIVVVDFWASWCMPCKTIDKRLAALAAKHPAALAIRRAEAPYEEADVVRDHLGGTLVLPQLWLYDRDGVRVDVLLGPTPDEAIARVEALLAQ